MGYLTGEDIMEFVRVVCQVTDYAQKYGVKLSIEHDFHALKEESFAAPHKGYITPAFDPAKNDLLKHQCFWACGRDETGMLVLTQAVRLYDLGEESLHDFARDHIPRIFESGRIAWQSEPALKNMSGRVAYHGEGWAHPTIRSNDISAAVEIMCQAIALHILDPHFIFGLCAPSLQKSGYQLRGGYRHHAPSALDWSEVANGATDGAWLVWNDRADLKNLLKHSLSTYLRSNV